MTAFSDILFLLAVIALIAGLINPKLYGKLVGTKHPRRTSSLIWGSVAFVAMIIGAASMPPDKTTTASVQDTQKTQPNQPKSDADIIKEAVTKELDGKTNRDPAKDRLRKVDVVPQEQGGYGVFVDYNANDNLTADFVKKGIWMEMTNLYKVIYTKTGKDVRAASVSAYAPMDDKYGNKSDVMVYKTLLNKDQASKVNWDDEETDLEMNVMPGVWDVTINLFGN